MGRYDFSTIEKKWQKYWEEHETFKTDVWDFSKPKFYALDMFPYPSGVGLHAGHPEGYTATDIVSRMKRMQGYNVLHPMGYDSFGLPAEQYAVNTGNHPNGFTHIYTNGLWNIETKNPNYIYSRWWKKSNYGGKWIKLDGYRCSTTHDAINEGWLYNAYLYFDYEYAKSTSTAPVYENTNFIEGSAGLQFFTDAPVFVHTLYSEKKLTETKEEDDLRIWEIRGHETGVVFKTANFTYNKSQYNSIPEGNYYITIAHFADGTVAASEIKKK